MRIAIVSDIHGNRTAFEAVLADLRETSPDLVLHGGDLADSGSSPTEIVDRIRNLGWNGVLGNTDEMHSRPESLEEFASQSSAPPSVWAAIREMATATRGMLGEERVAWLSTLPRVLFQESIALVHASPGTTWRAPGPEASDEELKTAYGSLDRPIVVYGHIHRSFIRSIRHVRMEEIVVNTGSVSLSYDGDARAAYLLIDDSKPTIRRVEYDLEKELKTLSDCGLPHSDWVSKILRTRSPQLP
ncbi:MAG TPA: metallophosphoesterase family protein [Terriglobales bacterium]|nr:metallophosphoesterase family protein [Candidatus Eremiobacteraceae bacterium]HXZ32427.1 metallophosphoesterase family protein [Terriglobales bacterium]